MRPDEPGDEINIILFHQLVGLLLADVRLEAVIFKNQFNRKSGHLAADVFQREVYGINHVLTDNAGRGCHCRYKSDFDLVGCKCGGRDHRRSSSHHEKLFHKWDSLFSPCLMRRKPVFLVAFFQLCAALSGKPTRLPALCKP